MHLTRAGIPAAALALAALASGCGGGGGNDAGTSEKQAAAPAAANTTATAAAPAPAAAPDTGAQAAPPVAPGTTTSPTAANLPPPPPAGRELQLPSGHTVVVRGVGPLRFTQGPPALVVRYETALSLEDTAALKAEATEVFEQYRAQAERARLTNFVSAATLPRGAGEDYRGYNFVWQRGADGQWHRP